MIIFTNDTTKHLRPGMRRLGAVFGRIKTSKFADNETSFELQTNVKRKKSSILYSISSDTKSLIDLLTAHRLLKENMVLTSNIIIPYFSYARQDRATKSGEAAIGILFAEIVRNINPNALYTIDIHSHLLKNVFGVNYTDLSAAPLFAEWLRDKNIETVVAPDKGALERAQNLASLLGDNLDVGYIEKKRPKRDVAKAVKLHGKIKGKNVVIYDDMISTGRTIEQAVKALKSRGAEDIYVCATHGILCQGAKSRLSKLPIKKIAVTNTLNNKASSKFDVLDILPIIEPIIR